MIRTFGVEEEFLLVNPDSGIPVDAAGNVLARPRAYREARRTPPSRPSCWRPR
jgi:hypothetical protein